MTEIKWQEPPPDSRFGPQGVGDGKTNALAVALRERPQEWALVYESASASNADRIKHGKSPAFRPAGAFEAVSRKRDDGKYDIYARFVGADS